MATAKNTQFKKGMTPWNKGKVGVQVSTRKGLKLSPLSDETKRKIGMAVQREKHPMWKGGLPKCEICKKELSNYNNKRCVEHGLVIGERNGKWIADRTKIKVGDRCLNDPLQKGWRKAVKDSDGWKCRIADENCNGRLEAHHILPWSKFPELRYSINNGITLCHAHHPRKRDDVAKLSPYFQSLVASRG